MALKRRTYPRLVLALLTAGCDTQPQFGNTDISAAGYANDFALTDHTGKHRTMADFRGRAVVIFFGYTQCPDVCPTTMTGMALAKKKYPQCTAFYCPLDFSWAVRAAVQRRELLFDTVPGARASIALAAIVGRMTAG